MTPSGFSFRSVAPLPFARWNHPGSRGSLRGRAPRCAASPPFGGASRL